MTYPQTGQPGPYQAGVGVASGRPAMPIPGQPVPPGWKKLPSDPSKAIKPKFFDGSKALLKKARWMIGVYTKKGELVTERTPRGLVLKVTWEIDGEDREHWYSNGKAGKFAVGINGTILTEMQEGIELYGSSEEPTYWVDGSNATLLVNSIEMGGFPRNREADDVRWMEGIVALLHEIIPPEREFRGERAAQPQAQGRKDTVPVVHMILKLPWETAERSINPAPQGPAAQGPAGYNPQPQQGYQQPQAYQQPTQGPAPYQAPQPAQQPAPYNPQPQPMAPVVQVQPAPYQAPQAPQGVGPAPQPNPIPGTQVAVLERPPASNGPTIQGVSQVTKTLFAQFAEDCRKKQLARVDRGLWATFVFAQRKREGDAGGIITETTTAFLDACKVERLISGYDPTTLFF